MRKLVIFILFACFSFLCFGQKSLLFYNTKLLRTVELKVGHKATLLYKGYLGQPEVVTQMVTQITDSTIVLGPDFSGAPSERKVGRRHKHVHKTILISDIIGFRRMTLGRQWAKAGIGVASAVGSFYFLQYIYVASAVSKGGAFLISLGTGYSIFGINQLLFPENVRYYFEDGWQVKVIDSMR